MPIYRTNYGTPDDGNTLSEKEYNEGEDAYHQINQLVRDGYLELVERCVHGNIFRHVIESSIEHTSSGEWFDVCPGAGIGGEHE